MGWQLGGPLSDAGTPFTEPRPLSNVGRQLGNGRARSRPCCDTEEITQISLAGALGWQVGRGARPARISRTLGDPCTPIWPCRKLGRAVSCSWSISPAWPLRRQLRGAVSRTRPRRQLRRPAAHIGPVTATRAGPLSRKLGGPVGT